MRCWFQFITRLVSHKAIKHKHTTYTVYTSILVYLVASLNVHRVTVQDHFCNHCKYALAYIKLWTLIKWPPEISFLCYISESSHKYKKRNKNYF